MSMTRACVISLCLLFHIVVFFKLLLTISNTTSNNTFKFKPLFVILLLFQLNPTGVTAYPFDEAHCDAYFK